MNKCFFWNTPSSVKENAENISYYSNRTDGQYSLTRTFVAIWDSICSREQLQLRPKFTTWIVDKHKAGIEDPIITSDTLELIRAKRRLRHSERVERFFQMLIDSDFPLSGHIRVAGVVDNESQTMLARLAAWIEAREEADPQAFLNILLGAGLLSTTGNHKYFLTAKGQERLEQAEIGGADSNQVFVAMWFGREMNSAYVDGIAPAVEATGFHPFRIDRKEHNNKIDDEIIAEIRRSRFMIADFTCALYMDGDKMRADARGGVYYEAGFAQGLGMPVIWTARADCIELVHFDTRQFAHIVWSDPDDLKQKLINRIRATMP